MLQEVGDAIGIVTWTEARFGIGLYRPVISKIRRLLQVSYGGTRMSEDVAGLRLEQTGRDLHQG